MWAVWVGAVLVALKWFEVGPLATLSWWWVLTPLAVAFAYFEVLEPLLGLDKKKAHDEQDRYKQKRLAKQLEKQKKGK